MRKLIKKEKEKIRQLLNENPNLDYSYLHEKFPNVKKSSVTGFARYLKKYKIREALKKGRRESPLHTKLSSRDKPSVSNNKKTRENKESPQKKEVPDMALEEEDLKRIKGMVKEVASNEVETAIENLPEKTAETIENIREKREKEAEQRRKEEKMKKKAKEAEKLQTQVNDLKSKLEQKAKEEVPGGVFGTEHQTYEEFFNCPDCMKSFHNIVKKHGMPKVSKRLCGDDETCKVLLDNLENEGYDFKAPKKDKEKEVGESEQEKQEGKEEKSEEESKQKEKAGEASEEKAHFSF